MDDAPCRQFFVAPQQTFHRRYEALRAFFVEGRPLADIAAQFGYKTNALKAMVSKFRAQRRSGHTPPFSFLTAVDDRPIDHAAKTPTVPMSPQSPIGDS
jgi:hypothetical protein